MEKIPVYQHHIKKRSGEINGKFLRVLNQTLCDPKKYRKNLPKIIHSLRELADADTKNYLTASASLLPALKRATVLAGISMVAPV